MKMRAGLVLLMVWIIISLSAPLMHAEKESFVGTKMPNVKLETLDGKTIKIHDLINGKAVVLNFTTPYCSDCKKLKKVMVPLISQYREKGVEFYFIMMGRQRTSIGDESDTGGDAGVPVILLDEKRDAARRMKIAKIPHLFIVDKQGVIRYEGLCLQEEPLREEFDRVAVSDANRP